MRVRVLILLMLFGLPSVVFCQHLRLGVGGGLSFIDNPAYYAQDVSSGGLGFTTELHAGIDAKLDLEGFPVTLTGRAHYTWMTGSGTVESDQVYASAGDYSTFADILVIAFGAEWAVSPGPFSPHLSSEILLTEAGQVTYANASSAPFLKDARTRVGFALGAGLESSLSALLSADLRIRYNWNTLFGRPGGEENLNTLDVTLAFFFSLY